MIEINGQRTLVIIPARGGSKRIPNKNIIDFKGKPIIAYSIIAAKEFGYADEVMVSTDNDKIAEIAKKSGANVPFMRNPKTADDKTGIADVLLEVVDKYEESKQFFDIVICILATAPLIQKNKLKAAYELLLNNEFCNGVCPVEAFSYPPQRGLIIKDKKLEMMFPQNYYATSQSLEKMYHDCGQFFILKTKALKAERKLYVTNMLPYLLDEMESQDIDNYSDLKIAEIKYDLLFGSEK